MATKPMVSIEEYLNTDYRPDMEYIDGELREKSGGSPMVSFVHGRVQLLIGSWFVSHETEWDIQTAVEVRTNVTSERVRLPDVVVVTGPQPKRALVSPPLIAIEVLSPGDTFYDVKERANDLERMVVRSIWLIDPGNLEASVWADGYFQRTKASALYAVDSPVYLDLEWLWSKLK